MNPQQEQEYEPIFHMNNKYVVKGWQKINPKNKQPTVSIEKMSVFLEYVFDESKEELEMQLEEDTDFRQMVNDYLEETQQPEKNTFTLQEAVEVLNWAVDPEDDQYEVEEQEKQQENNQGTKAQQNITEKQTNLNNLQNAEQQKQKQNQIENQKNAQQENDPQTATNLHSQKKPADPLQQLNNSFQISNQVPKKKSPRQSFNAKKQTLGKRQSQQAQDENDWGNVEKPQQKKKILLYKEINSYPEKQVRLQENQPLENQHNQQNPYTKKPLSIKRSLANLNKPKPKTNSAHKMPVLKLQPTAREMKYLKNQKIVIKNKKAKPLYHPQNMGLKELFKFYCGLNSEFYTSKHKDPAKGTFDQLENRISYLYMHNFMLLCKDFNIVESKGVSKASQKTAINGNLQNKTQQNSNLPNEVTMKKRNSKGSVPESLCMNNEKDQNKQKPNNGTKSKVLLKTGKKQKQQEQIWDRDRLSNYFKKQADYTLNVKYDTFIQVMRNVLKDKIIVETQVAKQVENIKNQENKIEQNNEMQKSSVDEEASEGGLEEESKRKDVQDNIKQSQKVQEVKNVHQNKEIQVDPVIMALCKFFKIDTQQNYQETFKRLKILYKILEPQSAPQQQKKVVKQLNGQFPQNVAEALKNRQLQKEKHRVEVKEKYLNKFSVPQIDVYSSFKAANNQVNSLNSIYGSAPKLIQNKSGKYNTVSEGTYGIGTGTMDYDMKKRNPRDYNLNIGNIIKQARNQIGQKNKENRASQRLKEHSQTQNLAKSRFNPLNSLDSSQKPILGYKKLHDLRQYKEQEETLSSILLNNSRLVEGEKTNRSQRTKMKSKDISSPLLQRMGCHEDDDLLNKYFDQQKQLQKSQVGLGMSIR